MLQDRTHAPDPRLKKRARILEAATCLFVRDGLRGTSMEAIAAEAGIAKATLYSAFKNKTKVFEGVAEVVADQLVEVVTTALARSGTVEERVRAGLCAKQELFFDLVYASPHADELLGAKTSYASVCIQAANEKIICAIEKVLKTDKQTARGARISAQALFFASIGIADHTEGKAHTLRRIGELTETYLLGLRARASQRIKNTSRKSK